MSYKISICYFILLILIAIPVEALYIAQGDSCDLPPKEPKENLPIPTSYTSPVPLLPKRSIHPNGLQLSRMIATRKDKKYGHSFKGNEKYYASTIEQPTKTYKYKGKYYYMDKSKDK